MEEELKKIIELIVAKERRRIYDRWMEIHKKGNKVRDWAASLTLEELARQEKFPPYDK